MILNLKRHERRMGRSNVSSSWHTTAFLVEALLLLLFLAAAMALFLHLFMAALSQSQESGKLSQAVAIAQNAAEQFSADPTGCPKKLEESEFDTTCTVNPQATEAGVLYRANISVTSDGKSVYSLQTARFVEGDTIAKAKRELSASAGTESGTGSGAGSGSDDSTNATESHSADAGSSAARNASSDAGASANAAPSPDDSANADADQNAKEGGDRG